MSAIDSQVCLITGCSSGFGYVTAPTLARHGATVVATMRDPAGRNAEPAAELRRVAAEEGLRLVVAECDVTDDGSAQRAVDDVLARHGRIDVLVNNAGCLLLGPVEAFTIDEVRDQFEVNVYGMLRMSRAVLPSMRARGSGLLVHLSSIVGRLVYPANALYAASKWAIEAFSLGFRYELAPLGVDSVVVEPGGFATRLGAKLRPAADLERRAPYAAMIEPLLDPVRRLDKAGRKVSDPQLVADAILALIETPRGKRPAQTLVGDLLPGVHDYNRTFAQLQEAYLRERSLEDALGNGP